MRRWPQVGACASQSTLHAETCLAAGKIFNILYDNIDFSFLEANAQRRVLSWCIVLVVPRGVGAPLAPGDAHRPIRQRDALVVADILPDETLLEETIGDTLHALRVTRVCALVLAPFFLEFKNSFRLQESTSSRARVPFEQPCRPAHKSAAIALRLYDKAQRDFVGASQVVSLAGVPCVRARETDAAISSRCCAMHFRASPIAARRAALRSSL